MKKLVAPSLALLGSAAVVLLAACSNVDGPVSPQMSKGGLSPLGFVAAAPSVAQICIDAGASSPGTYTVSFSVSNTQTVSGQADVVTSSPQTLTVGGPGVTCINAVSVNNTDPGVGSPERPAYLAERLVTGITLTPAAGVTGTTSYVCVDQTNDPNVSYCDGTLLTGPARKTGTNNTSARASGPHGSTVTFTFIADAPPPPPTGFCTVTRGFILNQLDYLTNGLGTKNLTLPLVIGGVSYDKAAIQTALTTPVKGDSRVQLTAQLITALANIQFGATTNAAVNTAITNAQSYLTSGSTATKTQITDAIGVLDTFNNGFAAAPASAHCTDAQEAILKT